jgi:hypothetical protein
MEDGDAKGEGRGVGKRWKSPRTQKIEYYLVVITTFLQSIQGVYKNFMTILVQRHKFQ